MKFFFTIFIISITFLSCTSSTEKKIDVSNIQVDFSLERFDEAFYHANKTSLYKVKDKFPLLFPSQISDSVWLSKINDKDEQELFAETQKLYQNISPLEKKLKSLFKHIKYYNPTFKSPKVLTILSNIDYDSRVIYADSILLISLDVYLGKEHRFYEDYPSYIKQNNTKEHIIVDVANAIINTQIVPTKDRSFSSKIITEGKKMYLLDCYLPSISDKEKTGYSLEKLAWMEANEEQVWKYFIEKELLYSTDTRLNKRFIDLAPFSKFYTGQDNNSPGRVGVYIGWQIVASYMRYNNVSLQKLLETDPQTIFDKSKYKPKK